MGQAVLHGLVQAVQPVAELARQALDGVGAGDGLVYEDGIDQGVWTQAGLPSQPPDGFVLP